MRVPELRLPQSSPRGGYERRRTRPILLTSAVLAVVALVIWIPVIVTSSGSSADTTCSPPTQELVPSTVVERSELDTIAPARPGDVRFTVLNAGGQRGQANLVSAQLGDLGFTEAASPTNDPRYPRGDMDCIGQVRFGANGTAPAATVALVLPCVELVRDNRQGSNVDVVIGAGFTDVSPGRSARDVLDELSAPAGENGRPAAVDPNVLAQARNTSC